MEPPGKPKPSIQVSLNQIEFFRNGLNFKKILNSSPVPFEIRKIPHQVLAKSREGSQGTAWSRWHRAREQPHLQPQPVHAERHDGGRIVVETELERLLKQARHRDVDVRGVHGARG